MSVRVGIIGCGGNMRWHLSSLAKVDGAKVVALADPDGNQLAITKRQFPELAAVPAFSDHRDMLAAIEMDAVEVSTPHTQHRSQVEDCFAKGLHVLIEKPLATTIADSEAMIAARDKAGKIGYLSYQRHTDPPFVFVRDAIQTGRYGKVQMVSALLCQEWRAFTVGSWRQDPALSGGGMFLDSGSHMLDAILWMTGFEPETVSAFVDNRGTPVEINAAVSLAGKGGALGTITICGDAPNWHEEIVVWLDGGAFFIRNGKVTILEGSGNRFEAQELGGGKSPDQAFLDAVTGKAPNPASFEDGLKVMRLSQAAYDSAAKGGAPVRL